MNVWTEWGGRYVYAKFGGSSQLLLNLEVKCRIWREALFLNSTQLPLNLGCYRYNTLSRQKKKAQPPFRLYMSYASQRMTRVKRPEDSIPRQEDSHLSLWIPLHQQRSLSL